MEKLPHVFKASWWEFFIALQREHQMTTQCVLGLNEDRDTEARSISKTFSTRARPRPTSLRPDPPRCSGRRIKTPEKRSSSHQLTLLSISVSPRSLGAGDACAHGQRFWKITRNSFPPWMENNKGIPHDRPLFLSSAGHKSTRLLIATPSSLLLYHNQAAELSSGDLINKLQTGRKSARSL